MGKRSKLIDFGRRIARRGWCPARSGNLSALSLRGGVYITASGCSLDRLQFKDILYVDAESSSIGSTRRPSAEMPLHRAVYACVPQARYVFHCHTPAAAVVSLYARQPSIFFVGYEMSKGFAGTRSHHERVAIPVFDNSQDMDSLSHRVAEHLRAEHAPGFLLAGHGVYTWGSSASEAFRHLETMDFLFQCRALSTNFADLALEQ